MAQIPPALTGRPVVRRDDVDRLRQRIDELRSEIGSDVLELEGRARRALDVRHQIAKRPVLAAVIAFGGLLVAVRIAQSLLRGARTREARPPRSGSGRVPRGVARGPVLAPYAREAGMKEVHG